MTLAQKMGRYWSDLSYLIILTGYSIASVIMSYDTKSKLVHYKVHD